MLGNQRLFVSIAVLSLLLANCAVDEDDKYAIRIDQLHTAEKAPTANQLLRGFTSNRSSAAVSQSNRVVMVGDYARNLHRVLGLPQPDALTLSQYRGFASQGGGVYRIAEASVVALQNAANALLVKYYRQCLQREPDGFAAPHAQAYVSDALALGAAAAEARMRQGICQSAEFASVTAPGNATFVADTLTQYVGAVEGTLFNHYLSLLNSGQKTRNEVLSLIANSPQAAQRNAEVINGRINQLKSEQDKKAADAAAANQAAINAQKVEYEKLIQTFEDTKKAHAKELKEQEQESRDNMTFLLFFIGVMLSSQNFVVNTAVAPPVLQ